MLCDCVPGLWFSCRGSSSSSSCTSLCCLEDRDKRRRWNLDAKRRKKRRLEHNVGFSEGVQRGEGDFFLIYTITLKTPVFAACGLFLIYLYSLSRVLVTTCYIFRSFFYLQSYVARRRCYFTRWHDVRTAKPQQNQL